MTHSRVVFFKLKKWHCVAMIALALVSFSCANETVFEGIKDLDPKEWKAEERCHFTFQTPKDSLIDLAVVVRHDLSFPYQNLYLMLRRHDSLGNVLDSSLHSVQLVEDKIGKPFGAKALGFGSPNLYTLSVWLKRRLSTADTVLHLSLQHYMRAESLRGVHSLGLRAFPYNFDEEIEKQFLKETERREW